MYVLLFLTSAITKAPTKNTFVDVLKFDNQVTLNNQKKIAMLLKKEIL